MTRCASLREILSVDSSGIVPALIVPHKIQCDDGSGHDGPHAANLPHWDWVRPDDRGKRLAWEWTKAELEARR
jgi:hypothetical protein